MGSMRILFINPCLRRGAKLKMLPVGLASVMTYVKSQGFDFDLYDVDMDEPEDLEVERFLAAERYDVILVGSIVTHYAWIKWLTRTIKRYHAETHVVIGNSVAASCIDVFAANAPVDVVVHGEGEITTAEVLRCLQDGGSLKQVDGISYRDGAWGMRKNPRRSACDINTLPAPDWEFFALDKYLSRSRRMSFNSKEGDPITMPVSSARGCAFRCTFCHFVFWDDPYRYRRADLVLDEVRRNIDKFDARYINFWDDLSFASMMQVGKLLDEIERSQLQFEWSASIRTDLFGRERKSRAERKAMAQRMADLGCRTVGYSLESANSEILKMMNKKVLPEYFLEQVELVREVGMTSMVSVVFGYPIETPETIAETFDLCLQARIYPSIGYLLPLPGTGMYRYAREHGYIPDEDAYLTSITERQDLCLNMTKMSDDEVRNAIADGARRLNRALEVGLGDSHLIRTGGYREHAESEVSKSGKLDPDDLRRNENDFSFNYSQAEFDMDEGRPPSC